MHEFEDLFTDDEAAADWLQNHAEDPVCTIRVAARARVIAERLRALSRGTGKQAEADG